MGRRGKRRKRGYWSEEEQRFIRKKKRRGGRGRMSYAKRNFQERADWTNRHHIKNKCRGGSMSPRNLLIMDERRHAAFHLLFGNMDFLQVINLLKRCYEMKNCLPHRKLKAVFIPETKADEFYGEGLS
jgi:hypothetical protein